MRRHRRPGPLALAFAALGPLPHLTGAAGHAAYAEEEVEAGTQDRRQPGEADPADRGRHVAFVQQHVDRDDEGERDAHDRHQIRPKRSPHPAEKARILLEQTL
jgi:hypothetical protein